MRWDTTRKVKMPYGSIEDVPEAQVEQYLVTTSVPRRQQ